MPDRLIDPIGGHRCKHSIKTADDLGAFGARGASTQASDAENVDVRIAVEIQTTRENIVRIVEQIIMQPTVKVPRTFPLTVNNGPVTGVIPITFQRRRTEF